MGNFFRKLLPNETDQSQETEEHNEESQHIGQINLIK